MKKFEQIGELITLSRVIKNMTQLELSLKIGYKNGQFISNVERGLCSIPHNKIMVTARVLGISPALIIQAIIDDFTNKLQTNIIIPSDSFGVTRGDS